MLVANSCQGVGTLFLWSGSVPSRRWSKLLSNLKSGPPALLFKLLSIHFYRDSDLASQLLRSLFSGRPPAERRPTHDDIGAVIRGSAVGFPGLGAAAQAQEEPQVLRP